MLIVDGMPAPHLSKARAEVEIHDDVMTETSPILMLSGVVSMAVVMAGVVVWNAGSAPPPELRTQLFAGIVASLTLTAGRFIIIQRWFNYPQARVTIAPLEPDFRALSATESTPITIARAVRRPRSVARRTRIGESAALRRVKRRPAAVHAS